MAVHSMTGFARTSGQYQDGLDREASWSIELRSVNGKGLDIRLRIPSSLEAIDQQIRKHLSSKISRGNVSLNLSLKSKENRGMLELNQEAFNDILKAAKTASEISELPMPSLDALLNVRNVLQEQELPENEEETKALQAEILKTIEHALHDFLLARAEEGAKIGINCQERLDKINDLTDQAIEQASNQTKVIKQKIKENITTLLEQSDDMDENRLHQEAMFIAVKADVSEELDRLKAHVEQANDLLQRAEPIGRRLDFLCQEFNREANTLCSKSSSKELTYIGLELKTVIDQLREQVQNIE